jgi:2-iminobutanoate/2-iminopropanoate deaminase
MRKINPESIAAPGGSYTHGIVVSAAHECLYISGQVGTDANGCVPSDIAAQSENCWKNVVAILKASDMTVENLVKVTVYLKEGVDFATVAAARGRYFGDHRPTSTVIFVSGLVKPEWLVEVEAIAYR